MSVNWMSGRPLLPEKNNNNNILNNPPKKKKKKLSEKNALGLRRI